MKIIAEKPGDAVLVLTSGSTPADARGRTLGGRRYRELSVDAEPAPAFRKTHTREATRKDEPALSQEW
jgi:hypothetical protein